MRIKSILPYFGSKRSIAARIVQVIGPHRVYFEPFCGSMSVLLGKPPCEMETVNDLHGDLINLAKVIQDRELGFRLYDKVCRTLYCEQLFTEAKERWRPEIEINGEIDFDRAYDFFVTSWMGINGVSGTERYNYCFALRWCLGGGQGARRWQSVVSSMPAWHKRLANVVIIRKDAFYVIENIKDEKGVAVYCDPPYFEKSDKYVHDFEHADHKRLAECLRRFKNAMVVVNYYDCEQVRELYDGWEIINIAKSRQSLRNATRGPKKKPRKEQTEVLIVNKTATGGLFV